MTPELKWDKRFMRLAHEVATWSKDPSTKVGAVVVDEKRSIRATGYNGPPRDVLDTDMSRWDRPGKYNYVSHAEENAVASAARIGVSLSGCTLYVSSLPPCATCARLIVQSGIRRVVVESLEVPERWAESMAAAVTMFKEAGVQVYTLPDDELGFEYPERPPEGFYPCGCTGIHTVSFERVSVTPLSTPMCTDCGGVVCRTKEAI